MVLRRAARLPLRRVVLMGAAAVILTVIILAAFFEVTSQPTFCGSCHLMRPYLESWRTSSHHGIPCMTCHAHAGLSGYFQTKFTAVSMLANYATGLYKRSKPWAEIEDANCLTCHTTRLLEGKIKFGDVTFDHTPHLTEERRGRRLRCTSCHSQIVQGSHITVTPTTCFLCHFKNVEQEGRADLARCTKCHTEPPVGSVADSLGTFDHAYIERMGVDCRTCHQTMWQGSGEVRRERCGVCHSQAAHLDRINDLEFIHEWHIERRKLDCQQCHDPIEHRQTAVADVISQDCRACHESQHQPMLAMFSGTGSRLVPGEHPDRMKAVGVVCMSCHREPTTGTGWAGVNPRACTPCHDARFFRIADMWRTSFERRIARIKRALPPSGTRPELENARHDLALVAKGGPWHNPTYADAVLDQVERTLRQAGINVPMPPDLPAASQGCLACHQGVDDLPVSLPYSPFNHRTHLVDRRVACTDCHQGGGPENPDHGRLRPGGASCRQCHHAGAEQRQACAPCHQPSRMVYLGELPGATPEPSPMAAADMTCTDCHQPPDFKRPDESFCLDCHGQEVVDNWKMERLNLEALPSPAAKSAGAEVIKLDRGRAVHHPDLAGRMLAPPSP